MPRRRPARIRRNKDQWTEILREFDSSGLEPREFCRRKKLALASFRRWRRRLGRVTPADFVELVPTSSPSAAAPAWSLEIALPNGVALRFQG
jgi:hypothetical protein